LNNVFDDLDLKICLGLDQEGLHSDQSRPVMDHCSEITVNMLINPVLDVDSVNVQPLQSDLTRSFVSQVPNLFLKLTITVLY
jgi:hypothetical protein